MPPTLARTHACAHAAPTSMPAPMHMHMFAPKFTPTCMPTPTPPRMPTRSAFVRTLTPTSTQRTCSARTRRWGAAKTILHEWRMCTSIESLLILTEPGMDERSMLAPFMPLGRVR